MKGLQLHLKFDGKFLDYGKTKKIDDTGIIIIYSIDVFFLSFGLSYYMGGMGKEKDKL